MKIILTQDVENLGSLGDTIEVKPGYGRNYLIPQGVALLAKGKSSKELRHRLQHIEKMREGEIALALEQVEKLKSLKLEITRKAGPGGKLFGSVNNRDLILLLKENGFDLNKRAIQLNSPIRNTGTHNFSVRIHSEVAVSVQVQVIGEIEEKLGGKGPESIEADPKNPGKETESIDADRNNAGKEPESIEVDRNKAGKEPESIEADPKNAGKDIDKN